MSLGHEGADPISDLEQSNIFAHSLNNTTAIFPISFDSEYSKSYKLT